MTSRMKRATETGIAICETISEESMKFIAEWDPDLHFALVQARKKRTRKGVKKI